MLRTFLRSRSGLSLVEVIIAIALVGMLFGSIYLSYFSIIDVVNNSKHRAQAASLMNKEIELIRNIPYDSIGTIGGIPDGIIPAAKNVTADDGNVYELTFTIRNIDDPFDGTIGGSPNDTAPADYKLVEIRAACLSCARFLPLSITTTVAPKSLESASSDGSIFINVFDASAQGVSAAAVHVINTSTVPSIDLTDTTNASGVLQLVGVPTSSQSYYIQVSKSGYSSERTYAIGYAGNPNPLPQYTHATVQAQTLTTASFSIDRLSSLQVLTNDYLCQPIGGRTISLQGAKNIGTDVYKNSLSSTTDSNGLFLVPTLEWDTYTLTLQGSTYDIVGTIPLTPLVIDPNTSRSVRFVLQSADPNSLLITVKDAVSSAVIPSSTVVITGSGISASGTTARATYAETNWSSYETQSGGVDTSAPGTLDLLAGVDGYPTSTTEWLISNTIDFGGATTTFYTLTWNPTSQPAQTGADSLKFQIASNNDNATWDFIGPDGTGSTFYTTSGTALHSSHNGDRYLRYKVHLSTADENFTPELADVAIMFLGPCVPPGQVFFSGLSSDDYTVQASASGYATATTSVTVSGSGSVELNLISL